MEATIYFITSIFILIASVKSYNKSNLISSVAIITASGLYAVFCFVCFGKLQGFIETQSIPALVKQYGYDPSRLPFSLSEFIRLGVIGGIAFNLFTAIWIWIKGKFWAYCIISALLFCLIGLGAGPFIGLSPLYSLFGACCGFMAGVAWVIGLTYVEFCVIGNIYIPALSILLSAAYVIKNSMKVNAKLAWPMMVFAALQIVAVLAVLIHYAGGFSHAFRLCVEDLRAIAATYHTTYEAVNIIVYVGIIPLILAADIIIARWLRKKRMSFPEKC